MRKEKEEIVYYLSIYIIIYIYYLYLSQLHIPPPFSSLIFKIFGVSYTLEACGFVNNALAQ